MLQQLIEKLTEVKLLLEGIDESIFKYVLRIRVRVYTPL